MAKVDDLRQMIADAQCIVAFTGAGISTESGIPDYRSPGGIWTKFRSGVTHGKGRRPEANDRRRAVHRRLHRSRHLDRIGHSRLPFARWHMDEVQIWSDSWQRSTT